MVALVAITQGLPAGLEEKPAQKQLKPQQAAPVGARIEEESQEAGDEEKDLSSSNTFGFAYYGYPSYYRSSYPSYYSHGGYRSYGYGGYGGYYSPYRYHGGWY